MTLILCGDAVLWLDDHHLGPVRWEVNAGTAVRCLVDAAYRSAAAGGVPLTLGGRRQTSSALRRRLAR